MRTRWIKGLGSAVLGAALLGLFNAPAAASLTPPLAAPTPVQPQPAPVSPDSQAATPTAGARDFSDADFARADQSKLGELHGGAGRLTDEELILVIAGAVLLLILLIILIA